MKTKEEIFNESLLGLKDAIDDNRLYSFYKDVILLCMEEYANQSKWISVEDELPKNEGSYLVFIYRPETVWHNKQVIAYFNLDTDGKYYWNLNPVIHGVTHWQPLPEPPKIH